MPSITASDYATVLRSLCQRGGRVMWMLGAGASASANVPTAQDLVWEFRRSLYCSREHVPQVALRDLGDPSVRQRLFDYGATQRDHPAPGAANEYAVLFELTYPDEGDRRAFLDPKMKGARASYGHIAMAALMCVDQLRLFWTTNFDPCVEDAHARLTESTGGLVMANTENASLAAQAISEERWPVGVKLHGDFRYRRLKNTSAELRDQDAVLRREMIGAGARYGLAVVGYSGRDTSVTDTLAEVLRGHDPFPGGLFWFQRPGGLTLPAVDDLINAAKAKGIDAHLVTVPTFDELLGDLIALHDLPAELAEKVQRLRGGRPPVPILEPTTEGGYPLIRLNAVPIEIPTHCRRLACAIGGTAEVREAVKTSGRAAVATRRKQGVLAFGADDDVRAVFEPFGITEFDLFAIEPGRLRHESAEQGLLYDALERALTRHLPLVRPPGADRSRALSVDPKRTSDPIFTGLLGALGGALSGTISGTSLSWNEGIRLHLERRMHRMWLCIEPTVVAERGDPSTKEVRTEFLRGRQARRYNRVTHELLLAWQGILCGGADYADYAAFGCPSGVDALFRLHRAAAFSAQAAL